MLFLKATYCSLHRDTSKVGRVVFCPIKKIFSNSLVKISTHSCPGELYICSVVLFLSTRYFVALCVLPQRPGPLQRNVPFSPLEDCLEAHRPCELSLSVGPGTCRVLIVTCGTGMEKFKLFDPTGVW